MTEKTYDEYLIHYYKELDERPGLRLGQAAFNVLVSDHPKLAERVRTTPLDPFYADFRLPEFFDFIAEHWEDEEYAENTQNSHSF